MVPILVIGIITLSSLLPGDSLSNSPFSVIPHIDKYIHIVMYFLGMISIGLAYAKRWAEKKKQFFIVACLLLLYSGSLEGIQEYVIPGRSFELFDIIANFIGTLLGYITTLIIVKKRNYGN